MGSGELNLLNNTVLTYCGDVRNATEWIFEMIMYEKEIVYVRLRRITAEFPHFYFGKRMATG